MAIVGTHFDRNDDDFNYFFFEAQLGLKTEIDISNHRIPMCKIK